MGEYDAVSASQRFAALAKQIAGLGRQREEDRRQLDAARAEVGQLAERVSALTKALAGALDAGKVKSPQAPRWDGLEQEQLAAQLGHLRAWVNGVLLAQYPEYKLPPCWDGHRSAWWELGNLHAEWTRIYANSAGPTSKPLSGGTNDGCPAPSSASTARSTRTGQWAAASTLGTDGRRHAGDCRRTRERPETERSVIDLPG